MGREKRERDRQRDREKDKQRDMKEGKGIRCMRETEISVNVMLCTMCCTCISYQFNCCTCCTFSRKEH